MDGTTGGETAGIPTEGGPLRDWLIDGNYVDWPAESGPHQSTGPHFGAVRTWLNPALDDSLAAGNVEHPVGSASVKELYGSGDTALGWAVMVKVQEGDGGDGWYWYERYDGSDFADGTGVGLCTGCHGGGTDFVLTPHPLQ